LSCKETKSILKVIIKNDPKIDVEKIMNECIGTENYEKVNIDEVAESIGQKIDDITRGLDEAISEATRNPTIEEIRPFDPRVPRPAFAHR